MGGGGGTLPIGQIGQGGGLSGGNQAANLPSGFQWGQGWSGPNGAINNPFAGGYGSGTINTGGQQQQNQGGFNQNQQNYIQSQGKLPSAFGGGALNTAQQNFFNTKGYLPAGFTGGSDLGQQYFRPQQQQNTQQQYNPYGGFFGQQQQQPAQQSGFNQNQQNYIQSQGKLPAAFGGGALNTAQQNFFNTKGYLPGGVTGDNIGQQYYKPQQQQQPAYQSQVGQYNPYQQALMGYSGMQNMAGSNKPSQ